MEDTFDYTRVDENGQALAEAVVNQTAPSVIFSKEQAGPVLGWTSAIAAYGAFLIPKIFATQIKAGTPQYALYGFAVYYLSCLALNWWCYARKNAEISC